MKRWQGFRVKFHQSVRKHECKVLRKAMYDVALAREMVFKVEGAECIDGFRISQVGVVEKMSDVRVAHDWLSKD